MSNRVDPDETVHYEPSQLDRRCLQKPIIIPMAVKELNNRNLVQRVFLCGLNLLNSDSHVDNRNINSDSLVTSGLMNNRPKNVQFGKR